MAKASKGKTKPRTPRAAKVKIDYGYQGGSPYYCDHLVVQSENGVTFLSFFRLQKSALVTDNGGSITRIGTGAAGKIEAEFVSKLALPQVLVPAVIDALSRNLQLAENSATP